MMYTLADGREVCAKYAGRNAAAVDSEETRTAVNKAIRILMEEGNWKSTTAKICFNTAYNCLTLPDFVEKVLSYASEDMGPGYVWDKWYEFMEAGPGPLISGNDTSHKDLVFMTASAPTAFHMGCDQGFNIIAVSDDEEDLLSKIKVRGVDTYGAEINPNNPGEDVGMMSWTGGLEGALMIDSEKVSSNVFHGINSIHKPITLGYVTLYAYDPVTREMRFLSKYAPYETTPGYRRYKLTNKYSSEERVLCLCKLAYVELRHNADVMPIQSLFAIEMEAKAQQQFNYGASDKGAIYHAVAIKTLEKQLGNSAEHTNQFDISFAGWGESTDANMI